MFILVIDQESSGVYSLSLAEKQATKYLADCDNSFDRMISHLSIQYENLVMTDINKRSYSRLFDDGPQYSDPEIPSHF